MNYQNVIKLIPLNFLIKNLFGNKKTEIIKRPACFIIKAKEESDGILKRIILLPPHGYTANKINEMNPHPEARMAKITIKGGVRPNRRSFSLLKDFIKFVYSTKRDVPTKKNEPYAKMDSTRNDQTEEIKSSKDIFFVVKENGVGFYHNLINLGDDWAVLVLEKYLRSGKELDLKHQIKKLNKKSQNLVKLLFDKIKLCGDKIFEKEKQLITDLLKLDIKIIIPILIEMLNIRETGKHEPCTIFGLILKKGREDKSKTIYYLQQALDKNAAPRYYLEELILKLNKS